jgi:hypothetical protein
MSTTRFADGNEWIWRPVGNASGHRHNSLVFYSSRNNGYDDFYPMKDNAMTYVESRPTFRSTVQAD